MAVLRAVDEHNAQAAVADRIRVLATPGLGTFSGCRADACVEVAQQMAAVFTEFGLRICGDAMSHGICV